MRNSLEIACRETVERLQGNDTTAELQRLVDRFGNREHLEGIAVYDASARPIAATTNLPPKLEGSLAPIEDAALRGKETGAFVRSKAGPMYVYAVPVRRDGRIAGAIAVFQDAGYIALQGSKIWHDTAIRLVVQVLLIGGITLLIVRWSMMRPLARIAKWVRRCGRAGRRLMRICRWMTDSVR
ncbi:MAG: hypothetical protein WDO73_32140 [Ignavibacteriota bacterium]